MKTELIVNPASARGTMQRHWHEVEATMRTEIDASIARALRLPDFVALREMLAREPVVGMQRL
jgi:diacylglycerol kinase family enzyme